MNSRSRSSIAVQGTVSFKSAALEGLHGVSKDQMFGFRDYDSDHAAEDISSDSSYNFQGLASASSSSSSSS